MSRATCESCGHSWSTRKSIDEYDDGPRCSECGSTAVEVGDSDGPADPHAGPGFDPDLATGSDADDDAEELREALMATPGVGKQGAEYAVYWFKKSVESPEDLHEVLTDVDGVDQQVARRVVETVYSESDADDAEVPTYSAERGREGAEASTDSGGSPDTLEAIIRAKEAGLLGDSDDGDDAEKIAQAVSEAMSPALKELSQTQQMMAQSLADDGGGEKSDVAQLREELEQMRQEQEREEIRRLEEKLEEIRKGTGADDPEVLKTDRHVDFKEKQLETLNKNIRTLPNELADAVERAIPALKELQHGRGRPAERLWSPPDEGPRGRPSYSPEEVGRDQQAPSPRQAATDSRQQQPRDTPQNRGGNSTATDKSDYQDTDTDNTADMTDTDDTDHDSTDDSTDDSDVAERQPQGVSAERVEALHEKLGLTDDADGEAEEVSA